MSTKFFITEGTEAHHFTTDEMIDAFVKYLTDIRHLTVCKQKKFKVWLTTYVGGTTMHCTPCDEIPE